MSNENPVLNLTGVYPETEAVVEPIADGAPMKNKASLADDELGLSWSATTTPSMVRLPRNLFVGGLFVVYAFLRTTAKSHPEPTTVITFVHEFADVEPASSAISPSLVKTTPLLRFLDSIPPAPPPPRILLRLTSAITQSSVIQRHKLSNARCRHRLLSGRFHCQRHRSHYRYSRACALPAWSERRTRHSLQFR